MYVYTKIWPVTGVQMVEHNVQFCFSALALLQ